MHRIHAVEPEPGVHRILTGAQFIDAYRVKVADAGLDTAGLDAADAAARMLARPPKWISRLLALRNALVTPFGLKTGAATDDRRERIGIFPIESVTPGRIVLGFDDKHLDFRLVVDVAATGAVSLVTATTLVRLHNLPGRIYLTAILPFHKMVVRTLLRRVADAGST